MYFVVLALVLFASKLGGAELHDLLNWYFTMWYVIAAFVAYAILRVSLAIGLRIIPILTLCALILFGYISGSAFRYLGNDMPEFKVTENIPVVFNYETQNGKNTGALLFTNLSDDHLLTFWAKCRIPMDPSESDVELVYENSFGNIALYPKGTGYRAQIVSAHNFDKYRVNPNNMTCKLTQATFRKAVTGVHLRWFYDKESGHHEFYVRNDNSFPIKDVQFNCFREKYGSEFVNATPRYLLDRTKDMIIKPGETVRYSSSTKYDDFTRCFVSNIAEVR